MSGRFLLDTNIVIALFAQDASLQERVAHATEVWISSIVLGELHYGARKSSRVDENIARIDELAAQVAVLACDSVTARWYGDLKGRLRAKGRPLPENDIWIAATVLQHGLTLVSRDAHFKEIDDLSIAVW